MTNISGRIKVVKINLIILNNLFMVNIIFKLDQSELELIYIYKTSIKIQRGNNLTI